MSLEELQEEYLELVESAGLLNLADPHQDFNGLNAFLQYMDPGHCRYLLSDKFERCGLPVLPNDYVNFTNVVHSAMCEALSRAEECGLANFDAPVFLGLSPYSTFGAEVMRVNKGYLVLISPITLSFCLVYATLAISSMQALAQLPPDILEQPIIERFRAICSDPRAADSLSSLFSLRKMIEEFSTTGTLSDPVALVKSSGFGRLHPIYYERVQATYEHFITFLVLHEFAHIDLGHMGVNGTAGCSEHGNQVALEYRPAQEEEADDYALKALVGTDFVEELMPLLELLDAGKTSHKALDKLWAGHTAYGRYASALLLMKGFDLMDSCQVGDVDSGISFTDNCEINGSHPSGQHRFIRALMRIQDIISLPGECKVSAIPILDWSNFVVAAFGHDMKS
ncbi:hypothetical protein [Pseudomonas umsongensis]|uniref:hypothetical protein n=1 Tax=Pseudomonas umsongensis TaxID=198618 RepID=UPI00200AE7A0|nr:hypothetical protein [Pseudomonas umsongensis]MCK8658927.1 hypothetical protein [Pseudomonas umsongensis]